MLGIRHALRISASHWARPRQIPRIAISATGALAGLCVGGVLYAHENTTSPVNTDSTQLPTANLVLEPLSNTLIAPVLRLETKGGPTVFRLIAAGCRKLYLFNVYTMSLYLSDDSMDRLKRSSRWRDEYLPEKWTGTGPGEYYSRDLISNSELAIVIGFHI